MAARKKKAAARAKSPARRPTTSPRAKPAARKKAPARKQPAGSKRATKRVQVKEVASAQPAVVEVAIIAAGRSALARAGKGALKDTRPDSFGAAVVREVVRRSGVAPEALADVVLGCAMPEAEQGMNVARNVALLAGLPVEVPALTINRFCSSGLEALAAVADRILARRYDVALAGGVESMSLVPMGGHRLSPNPALMEKLPAAYVTMGITAENVARRFSVSRAAQDVLALRSHVNASAAQDAGKFQEEIVPVLARVVEEDGTQRFAPFAIDEGPRRDTTLEALGKLKPVFDSKGSVTAGNSSQVTDGAAAVVLANADYARAKGLKIRAFLRGYAVVGVAPELMGIGPVPAIRKLLDQAGLKVEDIDLFEINEAFAAQAAYCQVELGIPVDKLNVNGSGISLGHPLGATGARQVTTLVHELERRGARYGVVSMCVGGGMGAAALLERV